MKIPDPLLIVARNLGDLRDSVVFVGGMIRSLLVTDPAASGARPTKDVDLIVEVPSRPAYAILGAKLRSRGFREASEEGAPICRWTVEGISADIMPVDPAILGFSNVWYFGALECAITLTSSEGPVHVQDAPHFCASKLEAFASRAEGDLYHHDLEDFIAIVNGREALLDEIQIAPAELRDFLARKTSELLARLAFVEALPGHLDSDEASQSRFPLVLSRLQAIAVLAEKAPAPARPPTPSRRPGGLAPPPPPAAPATAHRFLRSSNLRTAWYDPVTLTLTIEFQNEKRYEYAGVPETLYNGLLLSASAGRYHHQWIRGRFGYSRVR